MANLDVEAQWYEALYEGDCVQVMKLLREDPKLVKVGWKSEPSRKIKRGFGKEGHAWKGRNVLHVATWRGCIELIKEVLLLCKFIETDSHSRVDEQGSANESESREDIVAATLDQRDLAENKRAEKNGHKVAADDASSEGSQRKAQENTQEAVQKSSPADETGLAVSTRVVSNRQLDEKGVVAHWTSEVEHGKVNRARRAFARWKGKLRKGKGSNNLHESASSSTSLQPPFPLPVGFREDLDGKDFNTSSGDSLSRQDLGQLLYIKDGYFGMEPIAMVGLHFNVDVMVLLALAHTYESDIDWWPVRTTNLSPEALVDVEERVHRDNRMRLRRATEEVIATFDDPGLLMECLTEYSADPDFNFLPKEEYLFHFVWTNSPDRKSLKEPIQKALWKKVRSFPDQLWRFLLELQDAQGRTPAHVAMGEFTSYELEEHLISWGFEGGDLFEQFVTLLSDGSDDESEVLICALTTPDGASRTPARRAAASGKMKALGVLLKYSSTYADVSATCHETLTSAQRFLGLSPEPVDFRSREPSQDFIHYLDFAKCWLFDNCRENGLKFGTSGTPLHAAILTKSYHCAKLLIQKSSEACWSDMSYYEVDSQFLSRHTKNIKTVLGEVDGIEWDTIEFACFVGADVSFVEFLKKEYTAKAEGNRQRDYLSPPRKISRKPVPALKGDSNSKGDGDGDKIFVQHAWPALHFAAFSGNYKLLKLLTDDPPCSPFMEDFEGNTALHHAMMVTEFEFSPSSLDYVSCDHFQEWLERPERKILEESELEQKKAFEENQVVDRQGCINLLLQLGCDVFKVNKKNQAPYPQGSLGNNAKFLLWWYDKQEKEFAATQNNLNFAANAISVTAALVATASYVGPLQPPMSYAGDPNQLQDQNTWVLLFIIFDTMSFYLAIAAITFSLIPSLPMPGQSMKSELRRTRWMVTLAVAVLLPAVVFVFLAFVSSSFAVVSASITSSFGGGITIATTCVGGLLCLGAFSLFFMRLLAFVFPKNTWVRYFYDIISI